MCRQVPVSMVGSEPWSIFIWSLMISLCSADNYQYLCVLQTSTSISVFCRQVPVSLCSADKYQYLCVLQTSTSISLCSADKYQYLSVFCRQVPVLASISEPQGFLLWWLWGDGRPDAGTAAQQAGCARDHRAPYWPLLHAHEERSRQGRSLCTHTKNARAKVGHSART